MFSAKLRKQKLEELNTYQFDLVVIGGGITGAGIALDAVSRGLSVALIEKNDFASGTSSRSTKLIHGGLRYLKQFEVKMVRDVGREREVVYENAVHVTEPQWMLLPFHKGGTFGPFTTSVGLRVYDYLAGVKKGERRQMLSADETLEKEPLLSNEGLQGGGYYVEYRTDDARLTLEILKKAAELGALCINYVKADDFLYSNGKVSGVEATDAITGHKLTVDAKKVVNAAGPWVDDIRDIDSTAADKQIRLTKGVHIVVDRKTFPLRQPVYFDAPDGRMIFAIPRDDKAYIGTTDTFYDGDPAEAAATEEDVAYLLRAISHMFPSSGLTHSDVESTWAGVRPLVYEEGKDPSEISRKDEVWESENGLISIAGGKLTGYRKMAEAITDRVTKSLEKEGYGKYGKSTTKKLPLSGGDFGGSKNFPRFVSSMALQSEQFGLAPEEGRMFAQFYGTNAGKVFEQYWKRSAEPHSDGLPDVLAAVVAYAIEDEMAVTPSDFFIRRTGDLYFHIADVMRYKEQVLNFMDKHLNYSDEQKEQYRMDLLNEIEKATRFGRGMPQ
ncbi:glycerol-3-phosphate dehydrogenase/oxidase [Planococcus halotolerans]|uniref:Glycerol-3-phosphate dehydrogenase n=1 Tax=Planococcus halotolerans TaxID=2233542 RepID=A0A365L170_9BACL|nr:glycerol-3-phosphate dehydrogenase/oxidase [Planococcus halotolerans]QHJ71063.1 FAD-dependent oxidoreductase [Planococcus halotolerans]RAZ79176.1 glycerol-3-phosphate dehydrogenase [Planococcus halotolerans]